MNILFSDPEYSILPYFILGLFAMLEGPTAALLGGAASSSGMMGLLPTYLAVIMGNIVADIGWYSVGRLNKIDTLGRLLNRVKVSTQRISQFEHGIHKNAPKLLFFAKLTIGFPIPILIATGISRVRGFRWIIFLFLGELIKTAALVGIGFLFSQTIQKASSSVQGALWAISAIFFITTLIWFKRRSNKKQ